MTIPFNYPSQGHVRRHGPAGYADPASYRPRCATSFLVLSRWADTPRQLLELV